MGYAKITCSVYKGSNRTFMELKFDEFERNQVPPACSNRTFMELKYIKWFVNGVELTVLIVPLWNWNNGDFSFVPIIESSNRTFMELKFVNLQFASYIFQF